MSFDIDILPKEFVLMQKQLLGEDGFNDYLKSLENKSEKGLRINTNKMSSETFLSLYDEKPLEKIPYFENCYYSNKEKLGSNILHQIGCFYSQEPASMLPVSLLKRFDLQGKRVLDLCASPGGKSLQVATLVEENGLVVSNEIIPSRAKILQSNIERMGVKNFIVLNDNPKNIASNLKNVFDVVIVDAPCSGEGLFRKDFDYVRQWSKEGVTKNAERQKEILTMADKCLKPNGLLLYSTCTYARQENEDNVEFLESLGYSVLDVDDQIKNVAKVSMIKENTVRCFPCYTRGEGQFCALLKKCDGDFVEKSNQKINYVKNKLVENFIADNLNIDFDYHLEMVGNFYCLTPSSNIDTKNLKVVLKGVMLGEIVKNRFVPHHQMFSSLGNYFKLKLDLKDDEIMIKKYLKGEQLSYDLPNGYGVIMYNGASVGGFKSTDGQLKNLYPKGLRIDLK